MAEAPSSPLSFEDFVEAATSAALRATQKAAKSDPKYRPRPIWVGIIIRDFDDIQQVGNPKEG